MKLQISGIHAECNVDNIMPNSQMKLRRDEQLNTNIYKHTQKPKKKKQGTYYEAAVLKGVRS